MGLFSLEHSKAAYRLDFAVYGAAVAALAVVLLVAAPREQGWQIVALVLLGLASWTAIEYALHRFVLHGMQPFSRWHAEHHERPQALICARLLGTWALPDAAWFAARIHRALSLRERIEKFGIGIDLVALFEGTDRFTILLDVVEPNALVVELFRFGADLIGSGGVCRHHPHE